jgi:hypothetical protein
LWNRERDPANTLNKATNEGGLGDEKHLVWCVKKPSVVKHFPSGYEPVTDIVWRMLYYTLFYST